eukprot:CAMPEP_0181206600 /NCGR_PEP_ID=MMETSP1096-20121128/21120_1 /TAXON_ID=156174 ORGANISM="Chrysochromulina ericina, Strain CCMP281" /NCGR_SAMPLE_ID=MMETSP1096 /ASSEMBLY_ACC=CAM_ASM_000453 /LENGTH=56 /DNA_ID=CAMNT_0023297507 /DNA_START=171 /DNA_END=341 /DNA_ORIENTATION=-
MALPGLKRAHGRVMLWTVSPQGLQMDPGGIKPPCQSAHYQATARDTKRAQYHLALP